MSSLGSFLGIPWTADLSGSTALATRHGLYCHFLRAILYFLASGGRIKPALAPSMNNKIDGTLLGRGPIYPSSCHRLVTQVGCKCLFPDVRAFLSPTPHCFWSTWISYWLPGALGRSGCSELDTSSHPAPDVKISLSYVLENEISIQSLYTCFSKKEQEMF